MQWLAEHGVDVTAVDQNGGTALMFAAVGGHLTCVQWLAEHGADVTAVAQDGMTALMYAAQVGHEACEQYLASMGATKHAFNFCAYLNCFFFNF